MDVHDSRDGEDLYRVLRDEVIPLYYQRDRDGLPRGWIKRMKRTIRTLGWRFNADRMVMDYTLKCYVPAAGGTSSERKTPRAVSAPAPPHFFQGMPRQDCARPLAAIARAEDKPPRPGQCRWLAPPGAAQYPEF
jgi:hypothetical protein